MSLTPDEQLLTIQQQSGIEDLHHAAFIVGSGSCAASWGGIGPISNDALPDGTTILSLVQGVRAAGGDVIISFGGALGQELALDCTDPTSLQAAYQSVISKYTVKQDRYRHRRKPGATSDQASITRRDQALKALKAANPGLVVSYTLPVLPTGLINTGVNILTSAKADGLALDVVNVMAMDYGSSQDNGAQMGLDATDAAVRDRSQIQAAGLSASVGVTPMIGVNEHQYRSVPAERRTDPAQLRPVAQLYHAAVDGYGRLGATMAAVPTRISHPRPAAACRRTTTSSPASSKRSTDDRSGRGVHSPGRPMRAVLAR